MLPCLEGTAWTRCVQVFDNLRRALRSVGPTFANVVRTDMFVTDLDHLPYGNVVRAIEELSLPACCTNGQRP